jgi:hypothetical protein
VSFPIFEIDEDEGICWFESRFVVEDERYNYVSGRFPPDAGLLAEKAISLVNGAKT